MFSCLSSSSEKEENCHLIVASEWPAQFGCNPGVLTACLAGLQDLVISKQSEVVLPVIHEEELFSSPVAGEENIVDDSEDDDEKEDVGENERKLFVPLCPHRL